MISIDSILLRPLVSIGKFVFAGSIFSFKCGVKKSLGLVSALVVENYFRLTKQRLTPTEKNSSIFDREKDVILYVNSRMESY